MTIVFGAAAAYLVGCVPVARIASHLAGQRPWAAWAGPLADFAKGFFALAMFGNPVSAIGQALTLAALVAGDQWPMFGRETGRLGGWAGGGAMSAITPIALPIWGILWGIGFVLSGYKAIGRLVALVLIVPALGFVAGWPLGMIAAPAVVMVLERSRDDLHRIRSGEEPKHHWRLDG